MTKKVLNTLKKVSSRSDNFYSSQSCSKFEKCCFEKNTFKVSTTDFFVYFKAKFIILTINLLFRTHTMDLPLSHKASAGKLQLSSQLSDPLLKPPDVVSLLHKFYSHSKFYISLSLVDIFLCNRPNSNSHYSKNIQNRSKTIIENSNSKKISKFNGFETVVEVFWNKVPKQVIVTFIIILGITPLAPVQ